ANGSLLYLAASITEQAADGSKDKSADLADKAERYWSKLLQDQTLREQRAAIYWESRYYWLRHQLRKGQAAEVLKGINAEKAWYPDLGGPPWQSRILELADVARDATGKTSP